MVFIGILMPLSVASAGDFGWIDGFNIKAEADPTGFRARIEARFHVGDVKINIVLGNIEKFSDAYILFRLGEISRQPIGYILEQYKIENGKGWGVLAKRLGIKPGSREFHLLKQAQDLYENGNKSTGKDRIKIKGKGKGRK